MPGIAPVAMQEGRYAASVIVDRLENRTSKPFRYFDKGYLAVVGRNSGVGVIGGVKLHGFIAWFVWLFVHLMYLAAGAQSRAGFPALGLSICDVLPRRAPDHGR